MLVVAAVLSWELLSRTGLVVSIYFPSPSVVFRTLQRLRTEGGLAGHVRITLTRLVSAIVLGGIPGLSLGWLMGWSRRVREIADPLVAAAHPIPKIALLPLIMVLFGIGELSKVIAISVSVFFPLLINALAGVRQLSPIHFEVARNLGLSRFRTLTRVVIPGSLPVALAGLRVALNVGLLVTIAVELVSADRGIGARLWLAWETFRPEEIWALLAVLALIGLLINTVVLVLTRRLIPWRAEPQL